MTAFRLEVQLKEAQMFIATEYPYIDKATAGMFTPARTRKSRTALMAVALRQEAGQFMWTENKSDVSETP